MLKNVMLGCKFILSFIFSYLNQAWPTILVGHEPCNFNYSNFLIIIFNYHFNYKPPDQTMFLEIL